MSVWGIYWDWDVSWQDREEKVSFLFNKGKGLWFGGSFNGNRSHHFEKNDHQDLDYVLPWMECLLSVPGPGTNWDDILALP